MACAIPFSTSPAAPAVTDFTALPTMQTGSVRGLHGMERSPLGREGRVTGQGRHPGGRIAPVTARRGHCPPVTAAPDDLDAGGREHGSAAGAAAFADDGPHRAGR